MQARTAPEKNHNGTGCSAVKHTGSRADPTLPGAAPKGPTDVRPLTAPARKEKARYKIFSRKMESSCTWLALEDASSDTCERTDCLTAFVPACTRYEMASCSRSECRWSTGLEPVGQGPPFQSGPSTANRESFGGTRNPGQSAVWWRERARSTPQRSTGGMMHVAGAHAND